MTPTPLQAKHVACPPISATLWDASPTENVEFAFGRITPAVVVLSPTTTIFRITMFDPEKFPL
ncbi:hypothetical protein CAter282_1692 [Collimonas arenae]|uniref:Uncharacterized protein n=1 Tax=Collimonas arenae TaxID=279058 RepID=A0A127QHF5_9BURK|nr:hypothetical protein CAter10_1824 [Collimonas arenae]AMP09473.1 hypothetical protein CAter282_1692 [Collimonas arenae]